MFAHTAELPIVTGAPTRRPAFSRRTWIAGAIVAVSVLGAAIASRVDSAVDSPSIVEQPTSNIVVASLGPRASHNRRYHAEVLTVSSLDVGTPQRWIVQLTRRDHRRLAGAHVAVQAWMPETGEQSPAGARAAYVGGGKYRIDGIRFTQPGWWNVALVMDGRSGTDSVAFNAVVR